MQLEHNSLQCIFDRVNYDHATRGMLILHFCHETILTYSAATFLAISRRLSWKNALRWSIGTPRQRKHLLSGDVGPQQERKECSHIWHTTTPNYKTRRDRFKLSTNARHLQLQEIYRAVSNEFWRWVELFEWNRCYSAGCRGRRAR